MILITGAGSGLGKALAAQYPISVSIGHGCTIDVDFENMKKLQDALPQIPEHVTVAIHCVGVNHLSTNAELDWNDIAKTMRVNAISNFVINKFLIKERRLRTICHIVSDAAHRPMTHSLAYNMSKAAQLMLVRQMAREHKPNPIIFAISPGKINNTPMSYYIDETFPAMRGMTKEEGREYLRKGLQTEEMELNVATDFIIRLIGAAGHHFHGHNFIVGG